MPPPASSPAGLQGDAGAALHSASSHLSWSNECVPDLEGKSPWLQANSGTCGDTRSDVDVPGELRGAWAQVCVLKLGLPPVPRKADQCHEKRIVLQQMAEPGKFSTCESGQDPPLGGLAVWTLPGSLQETPSSPSHRASLS